MLRSAPSIASIVEIRRVPTQARVDGSHCSSARRSGIDISRPRSMRSASRIVTPAAVTGSGTATDGDTRDADATDGDAADGDATYGDATYGDAADGDAAVGR